MSDANNLPFSFLADMLSVIDTCIGLHGDLLSKTRYQNVHTEPKSITMSQNCQASF